VHKKAKLDEILMKMCYCNYKTIDGTFIFTIYECIYRTHLIIIITRSMFHFSDVLLLC